MNARSRRGVALLISLALLFTASAKAATRYVNSGLIDGSGANNGTSWENAWTNITRITGVVGGDTVYISAGPTWGVSTNYYTLNRFGSGGNAPSGTAGTGIITYRVGQDAGHNGGVAVFTASDDFIEGGSYLHVSGDAGDGRMHFEFPSSTNKYCLDDTTQGLTNFKMEYINCNEQYSPFCRVQGAKDGEVGYVYYKKLVHPVLDHAVNFAGASTNAAFDLIRIHHSTFITPQQTNTGTGNDILKSGGYGVSYYNNNLITYPVPSDPTGQHADGWQPGSARYAKFYNNYVQDVGGYGVYLEAISTSTGYYDTYIYNNVFVHAGQFTSGSTYAITCGPKEPGMTFSNIVIANNTIVDYTSTGSAGAIDIGDVGADNGWFTNCIVANNIAINAGIIRETDDADGVAMLNNIATNATDMFTSYTLYSTNNNYQLVAGATDYIGTGTNLSAYFTTDKIGVSWAGVYDLGALKYVGGGGGGEDPAPTSGQSVSRKFRNIRIVK